MNTNDAEFNRQYEKLEKILQHYKQFYGDEVWWDQSFSILQWRQINKEYINKCWIFQRDDETPTCSCICPPGTYHPVSKIILELIFKENMIVVNLTCGKVTPRAQYVGGVKLYTSCNISGDYQNISINLKDEDFDDYLVAYELMEDVLKYNVEKAKLVDIHKKRFYVLNRKEQMEKDFDA